MGWPDHCLFGITPDVMLSQTVKRRFDEACVRFGLLNDGDKILAGLSGGKDSLALVALLGARAKIYKPSIVVEAAHVVMDNIPYESDEEYLGRFCQEYGVPLRVIHTSFDESTDKRKTRCFLCARYRRKALFDYAVENGFNKVALGHHQDDFLTTLLMNMTYEGSLTTMLPCMPMQHYPLSLIRPLCMIPEQCIREMAVERGFCKQKRPCPYEERTRRKDMNEFLMMLERLNPEARQSMWHAIVRNL